MSHKLDPQQSRDELQAAERVASRFSVADLVNGEREVEQGPPTERTLTDPPDQRRPQKYSHGFFDSELKPLRAIYLKIVVSVAVLTILVMWACLSLYWGSLWKTPQHAYRLKTLVVDLDAGSELSQAVIGAAQSSLAEAGGRHLGYEFVEAGRFSSVQEVALAVHEEEAWAAVVINSGATAALQLARQMGDSTYSPDSALTVVYNQARNELAAGNLIVPQFSAVLAPALARVSAQSAAEYLQANAGNATAIAMLVQAPTTMLGYGYTLDNIHPVTFGVWTAVSLVGLIYLLVLSFIQTMGHFGAREVIAPYLTNKAYLTLRCITPLCVYLVVSFFFSMINLAFQVPFNGGPFTNAGGFFLSAFLFFIGMAALGLATEFAITLLTPKFIAFFLVAWIVINVSEVSYPIPVSGSHLYRVGYGMPFYNVSTALRTIVFGTKNHIGRSCGILIAWIVLSLITIPLATWLLRRKEVKAEQAKRAETTGATSLNEKSRV